MPFQSEKQRRYLWANEPEIARDWTDRYGAQGGGGIMNWAGQGGMKNYLGEQPMVNAPQNWRSGPNSPPTELAYITGPEKDLMLQANLHGSLGQGPNEGPSGIMSLDGWGSSDRSQERAGADMPDSSSGQGWSAPTFQPSGGPSYSTAMSQPELKLMADQAGSSTVMPESFYGRTYKPPGGNFFGNMLRGVGSIFGGVPGKIGSFLSRIDPRQLRGGMTQTEWEDARTDRRRNKSIDTILNRNAPITNRTLQNLERLGHTGTMPKVGSTQTSRAIDKEFTMDDVLREYSITPNRIKELQKGIAGTDAYEDFTGDVASSKEMANLLANRDQYPAYEEFSPKTISSEDLGNSSITERWSENPQINTKLQQAAISKPDVQAFMDNIAMFENMDDDSVAEIIKGKTGNTTLQATDVAIIRKFKEKTKPTGQFI